MSDEVESKENDALMDRIEKAAMDLKEHCDSIRIFATLHRDDSKNTTYLDIGKGNWYAQFGQIVEWVEAQNQRNRNHQTKRDNEAND